MSDESRGGAEMERGLACPRELTGEAPKTGYVGSMSHTHHPRTVVVAGLALTLAACIGGVQGTLAGPLNPPAGAIASTAKPLAEVEPRTAINAENTPGDADSIYRITQPGSYYLTANITGVPGKHGIEIASSGVTLDLRGFELIGRAEMGAFNGVNLDGQSLVSIAVTNGSVRNWGANGVDLSAALSSSTRVIDVRADGNTDDGIVCGALSTIERCTSNNNGGDGIQTSGGTINGCTAFDNGANGIRSSGACRVFDCFASANGEDGISTFLGSVIDCTVRINTGNGILAQGEAHIRGNQCAANGNVGDGANILISGNRCRVESNNCTGADRGIEVTGQSNIIMGNTCGGNTVNWDIAASNVCHVIDAANNAAFSGNSGGTAPGTTNPWANITY